LTVLHIYVTLFRSIYIEFVHVDIYLPLVFCPYSHVTQETTWQDPRKAGFNIQMGNSTPPQISPNVSLQNIPQLPNIQGLTLPDGWEQAVTPEGEQYYINHNDRTTSWFDPRLRKYT